MILHCLSLAGAAPSEVCAGCSITTEVDQPIVDFAVSAIAGGDGSGCSRDVVSVENFESQV